jgi:hypothetical protein
MSKSPRPSVRKLASFDIRRLLIVVALRPGKANP